MLESTLSMEDARKSLKRWMAGTETVKGLDEKAKMVHEEFFYFPIWYFKVKKGAEETIPSLLQARRSSI